MSLRAWLMNDNPFIMKALSSSHFALLRKLYFTDCLSAYSLVLSMSFYLRWLSHFKKENCQITPHWKQIFGLSHCNLGSNLLLPLWNWFICFIGLCSWRPIVFQVFFSLHLVGSLSWWSLPVVMDVVALLCLHDNWVNSISRGGRWDVVNNSREACKREVMVCAKWLLRSSVNIYTRIKCFVLFF